MAKRYQTGAAVSFAPWIILLIVPFRPRVLKREWRHLLKPSLGGVSRTLLAVTFLTALAAICPCFTEMEQAMDDCCPSSGLSAESGCCGNASGVEAVVSPVPAPASMTAPASVTLATAGPAPFFNSSLPATPIRPVVARTILRI